MSVYQSVSLSVWVSTDRRLDVGRGTAGAWPLLQQVPWRHHLGVAPVVGQVHGGLQPPGQHQHHQLQEQTDRDAGHRTCCALQYRQQPPERPAQLLKLCTRTCWTVDTGECRVSFGIIYSWSELGSYDIIVLIENHENRYLCPIYFQ